MPRHPCAPARNILLLGLLLWLPGSLGADESGTRRRERLLEHARAITEAPQDGRGAAIARRLEALGVEPVRSDFPGGRNIEVRLSPPAQRGPEARPLLIVGAHLDRVSVGEGAIDNASSCAILIELVRHLGQKPPPGPVLAVFFDAEERGLIGSRSFVRRRREELLASPHVGYVNLDVNAYGDTLYYGRTPRTPGRIRSLVKLAAREESLPALGSERYPPSDHLSFERAGIDTIPISILPRNEIEDLVALLGGDASRVPPVARRIHSARDRLGCLDASAMLRVLDLLIAVVELGERRLGAF